MRADAVGEAKTPRQRLEEADRLFNWATEPEIIDQAIDEMNDALGDLGESRPR